MELRIQHPQLHCARTFHPTKITTWMNCRSGHWLRTKLMVKINVTGTVTPSFVSEFASFASIRGSTLPFCHNQATLLIFSFAAHGHGV
jgi:hypothetical protein